MKKKTGTISPEFEYFVHIPLARYEGKYIAIVGERVVASGESAKEVWEKVKKKYPRSLPLFAKVPKREVLILIRK